MFAVGTSCFFSSTTFPEIVVCEKEAIVKSKIATQEDIDKLVELKEQYKAMLDAKVFDFDNYRSESKELAEDQNEEKNLIQLKLKMIPSLQ